MRVLVVGAAGMLGTDLVQALAHRGHEVIGIDISDLDITDPVQVARIGSGEFEDIHWLLNCAAYTAVDKAESEADLAMMVNGIAPGYLGRACAMKGIKLMHVSTDFVFDGTSSIPYEEGAHTNPTGVYGGTKLAGEQAVLESGADALIVRTAWLYGPNGNSFPKTMIKAWLAGKNLRVVSDQTGTPTYTADLARVMSDLIEHSPLPGIYHAAGPNIATWYDFATLAIVEYQHFTGTRDPIQVDPIRTEDWPTPAKRPKYSALSFEKVAALGIAPMRPLNEALEEFVGQLKLDV